MRAKNIILIEDCKPRYLYRLLSRNLSLGVYNEAEKEFIGIRQKFNHEFLAGEYHWDTGAPYGTASPLEALEPLPDNIPLSTDSSELRTWLLEKRKQYPEEEEATL